MTMSRTSLSFFLVCSRSGKAVLSKRFIEPNSAPSWNSTPNSVRISYSSLAEHSMMSVPSMTIEPRSGRSRPMRDFRNTDLPVPDGPSRTLTSPAGISNVTSSQILEDPKDFVSPFTSIATPMGNPSVDAHTATCPFVWHESL